MMIYLKKEISNISSRILFDQNLQVTWTRFLGKVVPFLESVQTNFGLADFRVILDETTTTADLIDRNITGHHAITAVNLRIKKVKEVTKMTAKTKDVSKRSTEPIVNGKK